MSRERTTRLFSTIQGTSTDIYLIPTGFFAHRNITFSFRGKKYFSQGLMYFLLTVFNIMFSPLLLMFFIYLVSNPYLAKVMIEPFIIIQNYLIMKFIFKHGN
jgi:putative flippase GtrA